MSELEDVACDLCGSTRRRTLYAVGDFRLGRPEPAYRVNRCRDCRLVYVSPRPTLATLGSHYPPGYDAHRTLADEAVRRRFEAQAELVGERPGRVLDVGAAGGEFVDFLRERGVDVRGVDPFARDDARHPLVERVALESAALGVGAFETITAWHVLEHLPSPRASLARLRELLVPGGRLCLALPNFESWRGRWLRNDDVPRHLFAFDAASLARYAEATGFRVLAISHRAAFAVDALGRGAFTRQAYRLFGGVSLYDFHRALADPARSLASEHPFAAQVARVVNWFERRWLTPGRLERTGKMGILAMVWAREG